MIGNPFSDFFQSPLRFVYLYQDHLALYQQGHHQVLTLLPVGLLESVDCLLQVLLHSHVLGDSLSITVDVKLAVVSVVSSPMINT